jgi:hypothetical protein
LTRREKSKTIICLARYLRNRNIRHNNEKNWMKNWRTGVKDSLEGAACEDGYACRSERIYCMCPRAFSMQSEGQGIIRFKCCWCTAVFGISRYQIRESETIWIDTEKRAESNEKIERFVT